MDTSGGLSRREALALLGVGASIPAAAYAQTERVAPLIEDVEFAAPDGVILKGALYRPPAKKPRGAIVVLHGAGNVPARYEDWGGIYAAAGFATLIYDKRGCGLSGGQYVRDSNTSAANLIRLGADAVAAGQWLRARPFASGLLFGFAGPSQAGWLIPPAAMVTGADFMLNFSGPTCRTSQSQEFEAHGAEGPLRYARWLRDESETDPMTVLRLIDIPGLWIYGAKDQNVPVELCAKNLDALIAQGRPYEYYIDPDAAHFHGESAHRRAVAWLDKRFPGGSMQSS